MEEKERMGGDALRERETRERVDALGVLSCFFRVALFSAWA